MDDSTILLIGLAIGALLIFKGLFSSSSSATKTMRVVDEHGKEIKEWPGITSHTIEGGTLKVMRGEHLVEAYQLRPGDSVKSF